MASRASTRITRNRLRVPGVVGGRTVIELAIPTLDASGVSHCHICASTFCPQHECCRSPTHLACCTQVICTGCLLQMCKRCRCTDDCPKIIALCPYCREVSPVPSLDIFRGSRPACAGCCDSDNDEDQPQHATVEGGRYAPAVDARDATTPVEGRQHHDVTVDGPRRGRPETRGRAEPRAEPPHPRPMSAESAVDSSESLLRYLMTP